MIDYSALLYDPIYAVLGMPATLSVGTAGEVALTVIDQTRRKTQTSNGVGVHSVEPAASARIPELAKNGITSDDYKGSVLTFNGRSWIVRQYDLTGSPNGEDFGEVLFQLMAAP